MFPNTDEGRSKAAGRCHGIYRHHKGEDMLEKITLCAEMSVALTNDKVDCFEISDGVTMIVGNNTYNGRYFPVEELSKSILLWERKPVVLNHDEAIENVVGHIEDVILNGNKLRAKVVIDNYEKSETAKKYIKEQQRIGNVANVSISVWYEPSWETINGQENTLVTRNLRPAHLGLVVHGACKPEDGCGIGLTKAGDNNKPSVTLDVNIKLDDNVKRLVLLDEVKERKERLKK